MIKKLKGYTTDTTIIRKIDELVDAVNKLDALLNLTNTAIQALKKTESVEPYAEQKKWIGKVCRFWDDDIKDWGCGMLTDIDKGKLFQYCCNKISNFKHCEPVSLEDYIIYKKEQQ